MDNLLKNLWNIGNKYYKSQINFDERTCEDIYKTTHTRDSTGKYIVKLPFKIPPQEIGSTRNIALSRLEQLENKPQLKEDYCQVKEEYIHTIESQGESS